MKQYYNLEEILKLNLPDNIKDIFKKNLNKKVFYDNNDTCQVGILKGIRLDDKIYYITDVNNVDKYIPIWKSMTKL